MKKKKELKMKTKMENKMKMNQLNKSFLEETIHQQTENQIEVKYVRNR